MLSNWFTVFLAFGRSRRDARRGALAAHDADLATMA